MESFAAAAPVILHPAHFDWSDSSSLQGHPAAWKADKITGQIMVDGFVTDTEVIVIQAAGSDGAKAHSFGPPVKSSWNGLRELGAFGMGYVKGSARTATLLAILHMCSVDKVDLQKETYGKHVDVSVHVCHDRCHDRGCNKGSSTLVGISGHPDAEDHGTAWHRMEDVWVA